MNNPPNDSTAYELVRDNLLRLHDILVHGDIDSDEAEAIHDESDRPWLKLTDHQRMVLNGLSSDLLDVANVRNETPAFAETADFRNRHAQVITARSEKRFDDALTVTRSSKGHMPYSVMSHLRGILWEAKNEPTVAAIFFEHARELQPPDQDLSSILLPPIDSKTAAAETERILLDAH